MRLMMKCKCARLILMLITALMVTGGFSSHAGLSAYAQEADETETDAGPSTEKKEEKPKLPERLKTVELKAKSLAKLPGQLDEISVSPDGRWLVAGGQKGMLVIYDLKAGKIHFAENAHESAVVGVGFIDGKLVSGDRQGHVLVWNIEKRRAVKAWSSLEELDHLKVIKARVETRKTTALSSLIKAWKEGGWVALQNQGTLISSQVEDTEINNGNILPGEGYVSFDYSQDMSAFFLLHPKGIRVYRIKPEFEKHFSIPVNPSTQLAISPDGLWMVPIGDSSSVPIYSTRTGQNVGMMKSGWFGVKAGRFSPDGRYFVGIGTGSDARIWDMQRQQVIAQISGDASDAAAITFSADGKTLYLARDGELSLVNFDEVTKASKAQQLTWDDALMKNAWGVLLSRDSASHDEARWLLIQGGDVAVKYLGKQLNSGQDVEKIINRYIQDLNADEFELRQKAEAELVKLGRAAEPALKRLIEATESAEARWRAQSILKRITDGQIDAQEAKAIAATKVLAAIGTKRAMLDLRVLEPILLNPEHNKEVKVWLERLKILYEPQPVLPETKPVSEDGLGLDP